VSDVCLMDNQDN